MEQLRSNILGVGISPLNLALAVATVTEAVEEPGLQGFVTVTGVHGVMESQRDPELKRIHNRSFLSTPDGMPMVWLSRWNGFKNVSRVYGPDLMLEVFRATAGKHKHFLFGGAEGVVEKLAANLASKFPGINICGKYTPPFRPLDETEELALVEALQREKPHYFWVGLSTPKQERFMHGLLTKYPDLTKDWSHGMLMFGVGAAFDFHAGLVKQAPRWIQLTGLEWLFRLCMEPKRLFKRYATNNPLFVFLISLQKLGLKSFHML